MHLKKNIEYHDMLVDFTGGLIGVTITIAYYSDYFNSPSSSSAPAILIRSCRKQEIISGEAEPIFD